MEPVISSGFDTWVGRRRGVVHCGCCRFVVFCALSWLTVNWLRVAHRKWCFVSGSLRDTDKRIIIYTFNRDDFAALRFHSWHVVSRRHVHVAQQQKGKIAIMRETASVNGQRKLPRSKDTSDVYQSRANNRRPGDRLESTATLNPHRDVFQQGAVIRTRVLRWQPLYSMYVKHWHRNVCCGPPRM